MATNHTTRNGSATTPPLDISGALDAITTAAHDMEEPLTTARGLAAVLYLAAGEEDIEEYVQDALRRTTDCLENRLKEIDVCFTAIMGGLRSIVVTAEETRVEKAPALRGAPDTVTALIKKLNDADDAYTLSQDENRAGRLSDDDAQARTDEFCDVQTSYTWSIIDTKSESLWEVQLKLQLLHDTLTQGTSWADKRDLKLIKSVTDDVHRLRLAEPGAA